MDTITEGSAEIYYHKGKITKKLPVFYNPVMKTNRDITIMILKQIDVKYASLPLAGTGIRGVRMLLETEIKHVHFNDLNPKACSLIQKNLELNKIPEERYSISNTEANAFVLSQKAKDYIDIDPFGSPNPFLSCSLQRLKNHSFLAVTATDTAPLCGTYPKACMRKYWANPLRNECMHETGLRILIRKVQLEGMQFDIALTPTIAYYKDHYFRIIFQAIKSKTRCDEIYSQFGMYKTAGPLWIGKLHEKRFISPESKMLQIMKDEMHTVGGFDLHELCKELKISVPKTRDVLEIIKGTRSHVRPTLIKTKCEKNEVTDVLSWLHTHNRGSNGREDKKQNQA